MTQYVALLRGINVGGNTLIKMADLKACFEALHFQNVATYIQSGNVLFEAAQTDAAKLAKQIERALTKTFGYQVRVVVLSLQQLQQIAEQAPKGFGSQPDQYHSDAIFMIEPMTVAEAMKHVTLREGVDQVAAGERLLYFSRLSAKLSHSRLSKLAGLPIYKSMTVRSWTTVSKLLKLMQERAAS